MIGSAEAFRNPLFGVSVTVIAYALASAVHRRFHWAHSLLLTCGGIIALLVMGGIPYESYKAGGDLIAFFLGPATVALAVPLYKQWRQIRSHAAAVLTSVAAGSICGLASAGLLVWMAGGSKLVLLSMMPKSVTTPISIELSRELGGSPELTAVLTVLAGLLGSVIGPAVLRRLGVRHDLAIGLAIGTASHGIGTARVVRESELQGGASGLAMALAGIFTSLWLVPVYWWLGTHAGG